MEVKSLLGARNTVHTKMTRRNEEEREMKRNGRARKNVLLVVALDQ